MLPFIECCGYSEIVAPRLRFLSAVLSIATFAVLACGDRARRYPLHGQVTAIAPDRAELTVKHEDIPNFMPAMTMSYVVRDPGALPQLTRGDFISATLVVPADQRPYLVAVQRTGHADVPDSAGTPLMNLLETGDAAPTDALVDQDGVSRRLSDWNNFAIAVTFMYTRCPMPEFCPLMDRRFAAVQAAIAGDAGLARAAHLVS